VSVTPTVAALNINASPVVIASIAATSEDGLEEVAQIANSQIVPEIQSIEGVATADLTGSLEPQVSITLDPQKLSESGVSVAQIMGVLQANNLTIPSGQLQADGTRIPVSTEGKLTSVDQIAGLIVGAKQPVTAPGATPAPGQFPTPVLLSDVGTVQLESVPTTGYARTDGQSVADAGRHQDLFRQHGPGRAGG
jgi:HAE1 family hydrophobic/amphiphilic exporter-1